MKKLAATLLIIGIDGPKSIVKSIIIGDTIGAQKKNLAVEEVGAEVSEVDIVVSGKVERRSIGGEDPRRNHGTLKHQRLPGVHSLMEERALKKDLPPVIEGRKEKGIENANTKAQAVLDIGVKLVGKG